MCSHCRSKSAVGLRPQTHRGRWACHPALLLLHVHCPHFNFSLSERTEAQSGVPGTARASSDKHADIMQCTYIYSAVWRGFNLHCFFTQALLQVAKNLFTHLGKFFSGLPHKRTLCINGPFVSNCLVKLMAHIIKWDIADLKGDYTPDHNHKIKRALKMMAPPFNPIITLRCSDLYQQ